jgi:membrane protein
LKPAQRVFEFIWREPGAPQSPLQQHALWLARMLYLVARDVLTGRFSLRAKSMVYTTLLALVPMLALVFSVLKTIGIHRQLEPALLQFLAPLGPKGMELTAQLVEFIGGLKVGVLGVVGLAFLLYAAIELLIQVEIAFNDLWGVQRARSAVRRFSDYLAVLLVGPVLVVSSISLTASAMSASVIQRLAASSTWGLVLAAGAKSISYALVVAACTLAYVFIPNTRVRWVPALLGALIAGGLWMSAGALFAALVAGSATYTAFYSGFAAIILFLLWVYTSWLILLFGARIAYFVQHPRAVVLKRFAEQERFLTIDRLMLRAMLAIARAHVRGAPPPDVAALSEQFAVDEFTMLDACNKLNAIGYVVRSDDTPARFVPAKSAAQLPLSELWSAARGGGVGDEETERLIREIDVAIAKGLGGMSLEDSLLGDLTRGNDGAAGGGAFRDAP